jgi:hypothetical protein
MTDSNMVSEATIARTRKRVAKMSAEQLLDWADVAVPGIQKHLDYYRRTGDEAHLVEASMAEWQLQMVLTEMMDKHAARADEGLTTP